MTVETKTISATNVPVEVLEALRPRAVRKGYPDSDAGTVRYALVELHALQLADELLERRSKK